MNVKTNGTKEWARSNVNVAFGCSNDCRYCYAKRIAQRFNRIYAYTWKHMIINQKAVNKTYKKRSGVVMFPSSHDITPMVKNECFIVLKKLLESGNRVIIVSKPNLSIIAELCEKFKKYQEQLLLRFTLTSICEDTLRFWEPGAPTFQERLAALQYAYEHGFTTSVSIEPFLTNPQHTYNFVRDYVNESVWIGIMSGIPKFENPIHQQFSEAVKMLRDTSNLKDVYERMKNLKYIRFKDGFMNALKKEKLY